MGWSVSFRLLHEREFIAYLGAGCRGVELVRSSWWLSFVLGRNREWALFARSDGGERHGSFSLRKGKGLLRLRSFEGRPPARFRFSMEEMTTGRVAFGIGGA